LSDDDSEERYFTDPNSSTSAAAVSRYPPPRPADERGYVVRRSVMEDGTRPEYVIPVGSADGAWGMIKCVGRFRGEGWMSLWKGKMFILLLLYTINANGCIL
jgi:mitochondrial fusion and transport protein UGO1